VDIFPGITGTPSIESSTGERSNGSETHRVNPKVFVLRQAVPPPPMQQESKILDLYPVYEVEPPCL